MKAKDVMTTEVVTVAADTAVEDIARLMVRRGISGVPVIDEDDAVLGIVSEGDLIRRPEIGTEAASSWLSLFSDLDDRARAYLRSHGRRAADVMSRGVMAVEEDTPLRDIARLLEKRRMKRVPVLRDGRLVGIVSRANLVQALAAVERHAPEPPEDDRELRVRILRAVREAGVRTDFLNVIVDNRRVEVWGAAESETEREALKLAVEGVMPRDWVAYHVGLLPDHLRASMSGT